MASAKERFQALAAQQEAARKQDEEAQRQKEEAARRKAAGGQTKIGTTKGQIKAFATAFEAIADGDEVEISVRPGGWNHANTTSAASGKWEGGPAGMQATRVAREQPQGPPPKRDISSFH
eukprot:TRINITY_DN1519_c0_g1_i1.p1 TRINITY_DN1519_c0_g1~~TRINITY_DN1519_c0_g1_i1.p1  ORF type:complete len:120 (+),score=35.84 TRINITY_DN1519_c0_g1_i1:58-417(+)